MTKLKALLHEIEQMNESDAHELYKIMWGIMNCDEKKKQFFRGFLADRQNQGVTG